MIFSPSLSEASDVLQKAPTLIIGLAESLHSPSGWVALALVLVWFLVNKDLAHLFSLFERKQRRRFELLEQYYLRPEITDEKTRTALGELRDTIYFKAVAGIYAERKFRHALIELHQHTSYKISWNQVRRALPYIQMDAEGMAFVRNFSMGERFGYRYNQLTAYASLLGSTAFVVAFMLSPNKSINSFLLMLVCTTFSLAFTLFVASQNWPQRAATQIQVELKKLQTSKAQQVVPQRSCD